MYSIWVRSRDTPHRLDWHELSSVGDECRLGFTLQPCKNVLQWPNSSRNCDPSINGAVVTQRLLYRLLASMGSSGWSTQSQQLCVKDELSRQPFRWTTKCALAARGSHVFSTRPGMLSHLGVYKDDDGKQQLPWQALNATGGCSSISYFNQDVFVHRQHSNTWLALQNCHQDCSLILS